MTVTDTGGSQQPANETPLVDAGENFSIFSVDQGATQIIGTALDPDGDPLTCRWLEEATVLVGPVQIAGTCPLDLGALPPLSLGNHSFTLEITDGTATVTDAIVVTVTDTGGSQQPANETPLVDAGENFSIFSVDQGATQIIGTALDPDGDPLTCRWLEEATVLVGPVQIAGTCPLDLGALPPLSLGNHSFTLEITDGTATVTDAIVVTVENSSPVAAPTGGGVFELGLGVITLGGQVSDFDGDELSFEWRSGTTVLVSGTAFPPFGGDPVVLGGHVLPIRDLGLGVHTLELAVNDGLFEVISPITVEVTDTTAPQLAPVVSQAIVWPPNHKMAGVTVQANATDNSGAVTLLVQVESNEPPDFDGDGNFLPDHEILDVNSGTGLIQLNLRAERSGKGEGRTYAVTITATDTTGLSSTAVVEIQVPHDMGT